MTILKIAVYIRKCLEELDDRIVWIIQMFPMVISFLEQFVSILDRHEKE